LAMCTRAMLPQPKKPMRGLPAMEHLLSSLARHGRC
jgi:hypothetical protein